MKQRTGFALPLVLGTIIILITVATSLAVATRRTTNASLRYRERVSERYAAESGLTVAIATIEADLNAGRQERKAYLNHLPDAHVELEGARADVDIVDVASLLDLNMADANSLMRLFRYFMSSGEAERAAQTVKRRMQERPLRSVRELRQMEIVPERALAYLTIDGDGYINTVTASDTVRNSAGGALTDTPTRLMLVSRSGRTELRAVYGIMGNDLVLIRWEESQ